MGAGNPGCLGRGGQERDGQKPDPGMATPPPCEIKRVACHPCARLFHWGYNSTSRWTGRHWHTLHPVGAPGMGLSVVARALGEGRVGSRRTRLVPRMGVTGRGCFVPQPSPRTGRDWVARRGPAGLSPTAAGQQGAGALPPLSTWTLPCALLGGTVGPLGLSLAAAWPLCDHSKIVCGFRS